MPPSPGRSPVDAVGPIVPYTESPNPCRTKLPIRPLPHKRKRPPQSPSPSPSSSSSVPVPSLKKTRYHPDLTLCHACKRRTTSSKPLQPLPSQWRVALLCPACFLTIRAGESCSYCFAHLEGAVPPPSGLVQCRRCRSRVHLACVPRMRGYASLPHDLDPDRFTCVDCAAIPDFFRAGVSAVNRASLDCAERTTRSAAAEKAEEASRARDRARRKAEAAARAVVLARHALDSALRRPETCGEQHPVGVEGVRVSSPAGHSSCGLQELRRSLSDLRLLGRELLVPGDDGYVVPSMEIERPSGLGDAEEVRGAEIIEQMGYGGGDLPRSQKRPLRTYSHMRGVLGRPRGKVLFRFKYSYKRKKAVATYKRKKKAFTMGNGGAPAASGKDILSVDGQFLLAEDEYGHKESSSVPNGYCKKPSSDMSPEKQELEENVGDKRGSHDRTHLASHMTHGYLKTYRRRCKIISLHDDGKKAQQYFAPHRPSDMPDRYLKKYSRKLRLDKVVDGAKPMKTKTVGMLDRYVLKYSRKTGLRLNGENEQVAPDNGFGNRWCLRPCTAAGDADAPQEARILAPDAANGNPPPGSSPLNVKF